MIIKFKGYFKPSTVDDTSIRVGDSNRTERIDIADVEVSIEPQNNVFAATMSLDVDQDVFDHLDNHRNIAECNVLREAQQRLRNLIEKVVRNFKYFYIIPELDDRNEHIPFEETYTWCAHNGVWRGTTNIRQTSWRGRDPHYNVDLNFFKWMPSIIESGTEPLFGFTHLHKAFLESNTRHQWIDATIAAELAFKEFLGKFKKDVTPLLTHLPSPPLEKMYGSVLEAYTGSRSPVYKCFNDASRIRNELIHRPRQAVPSKHETNIYLYQVQVAIVHLHTLLEPENELFLFLFKRAEEKLVTITQASKENKITGRKGMFGEDID